MADFKKILFATDFSDSSKNAFRYALSLAKQFNSQLFIIHVINEPVDLRGFYVPHISFDKLEDEIQEGAQNLMNSFIEENVEGFSNFKTAIIPGIPYEEIINKAVEEKVNLIITGTHGRTGLDHVLFGSTAEKVVRKSPIPVLTTRLAE